MSEVDAKSKPDNRRTNRAMNGKKRALAVTSQNGVTDRQTPGPVEIEKDFYAWALAQVQAIREHKLEALDWENIAEELEGMALSQKHALTSHLRVLLSHLLKWAYQNRERELHLSSWRSSIVNSRQEIEDALENSPSLGSERNLAAFVPKAYDRARKLAAAEMGLTVREMNRMFPAECPWTFEQLMTEGFLPEQPPARSSALK